MISPIFGVIHATNNILYQVKDATRRFQKVQEKGDENYGTEHHHRRPRPFILDVMPLLHDIHHMKEDEQSVGPNREFNDNENQVRKQLDLILKVTLRLLYYDVYDT